MHLFSIANMMLCSLSNKDHASCFTEATLFEIGVVQFYPWFNFYFPLFLCMVMYDNEYKAKENEN